VSKVVRRQVLAESRFAARWKMWRNPPTVSICPSLDGKMSAAGLSGGGAAALIAAIGESGRNPMR
jgi:hypothetical protein